ncbi:MAG: glutamine cyclotransferase [Bacteroidetes bacterium GWF2_49_14]|nr:MAG: glutamine cyclotransferase [Bacteroidetes bacterium GWF2_49_14]
MFSIRHPSSVICRPSSVICLLSSVLLLLASCKPRTSPQADQPLATESPAFSADSAYAFVAKQVSFGPRVPGSQAHGSCMEWMVATLRNFGAEVMVQKGLAKIYDGTVLPVQNIIARFQPEKVNRILLMAHWDSRPFADQDSDPVKKDFPIAGANDGASGVGVLMEIARQLGQKPATLGIDIILYDLEDYGVPAHKDIEWKADSWCLGSQYWAHNPHIPGYFARYGILLDMVGAPDARFTQEEVSRYYAKSVVDKVWNTAYQLGFGRYFPFDQTPQLIDDHRYVNEIIGIPSIDIIHQDPTTESSFPTTWHTQEDNMQHISRETLGAVGKVVLAVVYVEK